MNKGRKTTQEERVEIVAFCVENDMIQHSYRFFDDVSERYQIHGENFISVNKE